MAAQLPQALQAIQAMRGMQGGQQGMAVRPIQHQMSGAPVQMQGLLGAPNISVPQMNQMLGKSLGLMGGS